MIWDCNDALTSNGWNAISDPNASCRSPRRTTAKHTAHIFTILFFICWKGKRSRFWLSFLWRLPKDLRLIYHQNGILADCRVPFLCNHFGTCISGTHRSSDIRKWKSDCSPQKNSIAAAQEDCRQGWDTLINVSVASCFKHLIKPVESSPTSPIIWLESPLLYVFSFRSCLRAN